MTDTGAEEIDDAGAREAIGDDRAFELLRELVALAPTNLEDPVRDRYEKPNYVATAERIQAAAREWGLTANVFEATRESSGHPEELRGIPRPSVVVELSVGAPETVLILAHFDVVPVPAEQRPLWKSDPHQLTPRSDGRLYGRGANDDLGSGVVASLLAMRRAREQGSRRRNVRLVVCCDEETGGEGGIEAIKAHDDALPVGDRKRLLLADVALIPDGSPHATSGSSGLSFLDGTFSSPVPLSDVLRFGDELVRLDELARSWKSTFPSEDWPDHGAPEPTITGRATVTKFDARAVGSGGAKPFLALARAESDAPNLIAEAVTLVFAGPPASRIALSARLSEHLPPPFRLTIGGTTPMELPAGATVLRVLGKSMHAGYPHRGQNPLPAALGMLARGITRGTIDGGVPTEATFAVDLRLPPEAELEPLRDQALERVRGWISRTRVPAQIDAPPSRSRPGYALPIDHPLAVRVARILGEETGAKGVFGEYGGTDASTLRDVRTPNGKPIPAVVFGSMDRDARIHEAEESVDPRLLRRVSETIRRFIEEP